MSFLSVIDLTPDMQLLFFSFLWYDDLRNLVLVSKSFRNLCYSNCLHISYISRLFHKVLLKEINSKIFISNDPEYLHLLAERVVSWPSILLVDNFLLTHVVKIEGRGRCVAFRGSYIGDDRVVVADHYFPCLFDFKISLRHLIRRKRHRIRMNNNSSLIFSSVPFAKLYTTSSENSQIIQKVCLSKVAYFEITIHGPLRSHEGKSTCVAVGLACPGFSLSENQPGWDHHSYGYHSGFLWDQKLLLDDFILLFGSV